MTNLLRHFCLAAFGVQMALGAGTSLTGCATSTVTSDTSYVELFSTGQYSESYESASKVAGSMRGANRDQAALIAGLSAQALNRNDDAKRWLTPLVMNSDAGIAGKSNATLGLIAQEQGDHQKAVEFLTKAGKRMTGDESARAFMYAGDSLKTQRKTTQAMEMYSLAKEKVVDDSALRTMIGDRISGPGTIHASPPPGAGKYTVQAGAFSSLTRAKTEAKALRSKGAPRTVPIKSSAGQTLYAVRLGYFKTKQEADLLRKILGSRAIVTTTAGE